MKFILSIVFYFYLCGIVAALSHNHYAKKCGHAVELNKETVVESLYFPAIVAYATFTKNEYSFLPPTNCNKEQSQ